MSRIEHHVMLAAQSGWKIVRSDTNEAYGHFSTKEEAIKVAEEISKVEEGVLIVHDEDDPETENP